MVDFLVLFVEELAIGAVVGLAVGALGARAGRRVASAPEGLLLVGSIATAAVAFGAASVLHGSGFLAAYLAGLALHDVGAPAGRAVRAFHSGLASVAEIALFFTLGLLVFPGQLGDVAVEGTLLAAIVALVARPLATLVATAADRFTAAERLLLGWSVLRGGVPVVLATFPVIEGVSRSQEFFDIVFFAVLLSTLMQGTTVGPLARRLGLAEAEQRPDAAAA